MAGLVEVWLGWRRRAVPVGGTVVALEERIVYDGYERVSGMAGRCVVGDQKRATPGGQ